MPGTYPVLLLKIDGNVELSQIKQAAAKPSLKDLQTHLKKKVLPSVITTYPYGPKRVTAIGYTKGKEDELSQHQLPPPCEINEVYGTIVLLVHPSKVTWDSSTSSVELFTPSNYEEFYEKACSGDLIEDGDDDADADVEDGDEIVEEEAEGDEAEDEEGEGEEAEGEVEEADLLEDEIEEAPRPVQRRKIIKIDPQQLQFQFKSNLVPEGECTPESAANLLKVKERAHILEVLSKLLSQHCDKDDLNELERGIYNASLNEAKTRQIPLTWEHETFRWIHQMIAKRAISNFNPDSYVGNTHLIQRWKNGEFTLDQLGGWTPYELKPMHWKDLKDQLLKREQRILEGNMSMATDRFRCSQCKEKKCSYYELQTRSADEPMTIFVKCLNCGKQWKQ